MNRLKINTGFLGLVLMNFFLANCGPSATFETPQPTNIKAAKSFDKKIQGKFISLDSSYTLTIRENFILSEYEEYLELHIDSLNNGFKLVGDSIIDLHDGSVSNVTRMDTLITWSKHRIDTLFSIKNGSVLKKYQGHYFLNKKSEETQNWTVNKLSLDKDLLTYSSIASQDAINILNEITETPTDTTLSTVNYDISKKQFKEFLKSNGFSGIDTFMRINNQSLLK